MKKMNKSFDPSTTPAATPAEIKRAIDRAHQLRSEEFRRIARRIGAWLHGSAGAGSHDRSRLAGCHQA